MAGMETARVPTLPRWASYVRKSKEDKESEEVQEAALLATVAKRGVEIGTGYRFRDSFTGNTPLEKRPAGRALVGAIQRREIDVIVVRDLTRLSREDPLEAMLFRRRVRAEYGVRIVSIMEPYLELPDDATPLDRLMAEFAEFLTSWMAHHKSVITSQQTKISLELRRSKGQHLGRHRKGCGLNFPCPNGRHDILGNYTGPHKWPGMPKAA